MVGEMTVNLGKFDFVVRAVTTLTEWSLMVFVFAWFGVVLFMR